MRLTTGTGGLGRWAVGILVTMPVLLAACGGSISGAQRFFAIMPLDFAEGATDFQYTDIAALEKDERAADIMVALEDSWPFSDELQFELGDAQWVGDVENEITGRRLFVVGGITEDIAEDLREEMDDRDYRDDTYRGVESWRRASALTVSFLDDGVVLLAGADDTKTIIRHLDRENSDSLWGEYESVIAELPSDGPFVFIDACYEWLELEDCDRVAGVGRIISQFDVVEHTRIVFETERDADRAEDDVIEAFAALEDSILGDFISDVGVSVEKNVVAVTTTFETEKLIEFGVLDW